MKLAIGLACESLKGAP